MVEIRIRKREYIQKIANKRKTRYNKIQILLIYFVFSPFLLLLYFLLILIIHLIFTLCVNFENENKVEIPNTQEKRGKMKNLKV